jgi:nitrite reductase (NADH) large subunit
VGIDRLRSVLVDDSEDILGRLDEAMQASVDAYADPWREGDAPVTPGQFRRSLPLVELPKVPVR